jgi:competence protein ComEC
MGMRLFFFISILHSLLFSLSAGCDYSPFSHIDGGIAVITEDLSKKNRNLSLHLIEAWEGPSLKGGSSYYTHVWVQPPDVPHYKGEIVRVLFSPEGDLSSHIIYSGDYIKKSYKMRGEIISHLRESVSPLGEPGYLLEALLLGQTDRIGDLDLLFREAGVSHLLALSGLHLGIVVTLFYLMIKFWIPFRLRGPVTFVFLNFYSWIIGVKHSFIRAVIMYGIVNLLQIMKIKPSLGKVLFLSALLQVILFPSALGTWSYLLSYGAMGGIILISNPWILFFKKLSPDIVALPLGVSCAAQSVIIPLILPAFGWVQLSGLGASLLLTPLIVLYIWGGLAILVLLMIAPSLLYPIKAVIAPFYRLIIKLTLIFGKFPLVYWESSGGKLLFLLLISVIIALICLSILKDGNIGRKNSQVELRLTIGDQSSVGDDGIRPQKEMGAELSH